MPDSSSVYIGEAIRKSGSILLLLEYGSKAHGTANSQSDHDFMAVIAEKSEYVTGMRGIDTFEVKTASKGRRSGSEDTDMTIYPLKKWAKLAAKGNPTVLTALFAPSYEEITPSGKRLVDSSDLFVSKAAGLAFLGYINSQRLAMTGMRNKRTNRPELLHTHGYDTKFAYHMLRLGFQGIELMRTGRFTFPIPAGSRETLINIRNGSIEKDWAIDLAERLDQDLKRAITGSSLPETANHEAINQLIHEIYLEEWAR